MTDPARRPDLAAIQAAAEVWRRGGLVAFPTETVYGLGADAANERAVARIFAAKGRPADHPLIVHVAAAAEIERWAREIPEVAWLLAATFWPGPLTLILKRRPGVSDLVTGGQDTVGLRVPGHPVALALLEAFGGGIAAPSANRFGRVSPTSAAHVVAEFGTALDCIVDGGSCPVGLESTILDLSGELPRVLRPGGVTRRTLGELLGEVPEIGGAEAPRAPGRLAAHYVPDTPLRLVADAAAELASQSLWSDGKPVAVLARRAPTAPLEHGRWVIMPDDPVSYGRELYARLRDVDAWGCELLLVEQPPSSEGWEAVQDRLTRATGGRGQSPPESPAGG